MQNWKEEVTIKGMTCDEHCINMIDLVGIPKCYWYGHYDGFNCMVMDLLGSSLKELRQSVKDIQLDVIVDLGCQMVSK